MRDNSLTGAGVTIMNIASPGPKGGPPPPEVVAQQALSLAEAHNTPPVPKTFEVWYACAIGVPENLRRKIEATIARNGGISSYELDQLHQEYLSVTEQQHRQQEMAHRFFDREMQKAIDLVQKHIGTNEQCSGSIEKTASAMNASTDPRQLKEALGYLVSELAKMRAESAKLNHNLHQTRLQVRSLSASLEKARENECRDPLTLIANRRYFDRMLPRYMADSRGTTLCFVMADIDHFKAINDRFGHQAGDDVLKYFAALMQQNLKGHDVVARMGGEEFALILPFTEPADARKVIGQIMAQLDKANLVVARDKDPIGKVTCSFGIARMRTGETPDSFIGRADEKLYEAKQMGRNRIVCDP